MTATTWACLLGILTMRVEQLSGVTVVLAVRW